MAGTRVISAGKFQPSGISGKWVTFLGYARRLELSSWYHTGTSHFRTPSLLSPYTHHHLTISTGTPSWFSSSSQVSYKSKFILDSFLFRVSPARFLKMSGRQRWFFHTVTWSIVLALLGSIITAGTNFQPFVLILFSLCFTIATKCVYEFSEGCDQSFRSYGSFSRKWVA